jgi:hypothetical protein
MAGACIQASAEETAGAGMQPKAKNKITIIGRTALQADPT